MGQGGAHTESPHQGRAADGWDEKVTAMGDLHQGSVLQATFTGNFQWEPDFTGQWQVLGFSS